MSHIPDFDLLNLSDSFFEVHEIRFEDENELFSLSSFVESVVRSNPKARFDGVFKGRVANSNYDSKGAFWETFNQNGLGKHLAAQFLISSDGDKCFVMEHKNIKINPHKASFSKSVLNPETFKAPKPNCCTRAMNQGGPKQAVKHFYEALMSKAIPVPKWQELTSDDSVNTKRARYEARQSILKIQDPFAKCALIEKSMKSKAYEAKPPSGDGNQGNHCMCHICHLHEESEKVLCEPINLRDNGEGDNCSLYFSGIEESEEDKLYITPNFALSHLCHLNMLTDLDSYYRGISYPFMYIGGLHSYFPIHIEDMSLWSINYHHAGHPKLWIIVAPSDVSKLSQLLTLYNLHNLHRVCAFKLTHKSTILFPQFLLHHNIHFKIIIQKPGDFVFLAPNAAHTGGNFGENISEACNIGTSDWLPYGSVASTQDCRCMEDKIHIDVTALIKIHRKDLLQYHLRKSMHRDFKDGHFEHSIILFSADTKLEDKPFNHKIESGSPTSSSSVSVTKPVKARNKAPIACPVKFCFAEYKVPSKKALLSHIQREHPDQATSKKLLKCVDALFPN